MKSKKEKEAIEALKKLREDNDVESAHFEADRIILLFVPDDVQKAWHDVKKWYA